MTPAPVTSPGSVKILLTNFEPVLRGWLFSLIHRWAKPLIQNFIILRFLKMRRLCWCGTPSKNIPCDRCKTKRRNEKRSEDYDHQWRVLSERFRAEHPLCHDCWENGREEPSRDVHHIIPIRDAPHRRLDVNNLVALCKKCHSDRHREL